MKKYLGLLLLLVSFTSFGQFSNYTNINGRYKWIAGKFDSTFTIPSGTTPSLRVGGGTGPGALFYSTTDSTVYQYTGTRWTRLRGTDTAHVVSAYVRNTTASTMTAGQVVYINGSTGTTPTIALAVNTADSTSAMTFGFVRGTIAPNAFGWITTFGPLEGVNTNAYTEGEVIYLDSIPGQFTHFKPQAPYHMVTLGYIVKKSGGNGTIFAKVQNGYELEELHNVRITSPVRNNGILAYDSVAQLWKDTTLSAIGGVTGSGTSGQVAYWTGTSSQSGSNNLFWDAANNRLGIGTNAPAVGLEVRNGANIYTSGAVANSHYLEFVSTSNINGYVNFRRAGNQNGDYAYQLINNVASFRANNGTGEVSLFATSGGYFLNFYSGGTEAMRIFSTTRNVLIQNGGTFTDGGQRLQVTGDVLFKGSGNTSGTTALTVQNSDATNLMTIRNDGLTTISTASGSVQVSRSGNLFSIDRASLRVLNDGVNISFAVFPAIGSRTVAETNNIVTTGMTVNPTSGPTVYNMYSVSPTINQTGGANGITRGLYVNPTLTAAADWRSIQWDNNSGWGLYGAGTANNYLAGSLGIGSTSLTGYNLRMSKAITGATTSYGMSINSSILSGVTGDAVIYHSFPSTQAASFTTYVNHFYAQSAFNGAGSTIEEEFGFRAVVGTYSNRAYGFYGSVASGTNKWNLYMNGTANNYMNGNLLLGSTVDGGQKLQVTGTSRFTGNLRFDANMRDNRDNTVIEQSASGVVSNRDFTIGNGGYGRMMFTSKQYSFTTGTHPSLGAYGFYYNAETNTGVGNGTSIYFKAQTPSAANSNGGDFIIELPSGTGTGRQGSVIIGGTSPNASAILELSSTTKGFLPPRMTGTEAEAIASPGAGLLVFITNGNGTTITSVGWWGYDSSGWVKLN